MKILSLTFMSILALGAHVSSAAAGSTTVDAVSYACANNETMRVVYVNGADGKSFAILLQMDEMIPMAEQRAASGAVYKAINRNYTYVLRTDGNNATLSDSRETLLSGCTE
ncbi:MliC family protein [Agrobacterium sp. DE0009]|uniref:MliC family protein n=1 Tax=Agrobacterium sp. DE0009 TaxID=2587505 RepID=UPI0011A9B0B9|nr:MliC family protein [Agrobacterium sp. DE0009]